MFELPDALLLARNQFAFTISFHFLFPAITIGLASDLAVLEGVWLKTGREDYMNLFRDWIKIFALVFAMGVMLFGMKRVGKGLHFTATLMVALGPFASAFWILSVNSGMQTRRLRDQRQRSVHLCGQLVGHHLQPQLSRQAASITVLLAVALVLRWVLKP